MIAPQNVVTFDEVEGLTIARALGYVSGIAMRPRNRLRATFRSLGMLIGVAPSEFVSDAEQLRTEALAQMVKRGDALGANAIIGLNFYVSESGDGSTKVVAFGKAVQVVPAERA